MAIQENPYLPPASRVADAEIVHGAYVDGGRAVPPGHGWEWISSGWSLFRRQAGTWALIAFILGVLVIVISFIPFVGSVALPLLLPALVAGLMRGCEKLEREEPIELADLFSVFQTGVGAGPLVLLGLIGFGLSVAAIIPAVVVLLVVGFTGSSMGASPVYVFLLVFLIYLALLLPVYMALWFGPPLAGLQEQSPTRAIGQSFRGCLKNIVPFLVYSVIMFVFAVIATVPLGLGWLVLGPVLIASVYTAYRDIYFDS